MAEPGRMIYEECPLAIIILTPIFAILGTMVNKNMSFFLMH